MHALHEQDVQFTRLRVLSTIDMNDYRRVLTSMLMLRMFRLFDITALLHAS
jgi:hypothetical protein